MCGQTRGTCMLSCLAVGIGDIHDEAWQLQHLPRTHPQDPRPCELARLDKYARCYAANRAQDTPAAPARKGTVKLLHIAKETCPHDTCWPVEQHQPDSTPWPDLFEN